MRHCFCVYRHIELTNFREFVNVSGTFRPLTIKTHTSMSSSFFFFALTAAYIHPTGVSNSCQTCNEFQCSSYSYNIAETKDLATVHNNTSDKVLM